MTGIAARPSALADEHSEKLAENLNRNDGALLRYPVNERQSGITWFNTVDAFRVGEHVRIERDPHGSSS